MAKRGLMAATAISMVILVCPSGYAAMAESNANQSVRQSVGMTTEHTQRDIDCTKARADQQCGGAANQCFYKFTVNEVVDQQKLKVTYPPTVWKDTVWAELPEWLPESDRNPQAEEDYKNKIGENPFSITTLNPTDKRMKDKTYVFTRCPENEFTVGPEIDPNETGKPVGLQQSVR